MNKLAKRLTSFTLMLVIIISANAVVSADEVKEEKSPIKWYEQEYLKHDTNLSLEEFKDAAEYAYMDSESASENQMKKIINARETIIFEESWTAEAGIAWIETDTGEVEELPEFYSIFPTDWDIPAERTEKDMKSILTSFADIKMGIMPMATYGGVYNGNVTLKAAGSSDAKDFYNWSFAYSRITRIYATSLPGTYVNFGFTSNGKSVAYATNRRVNEKLVTTLSGAEGNRHGARCSTYSTTGTARVVIDFEY